MMLPKGYTGLIEQLDKTDVRIPRLLGQLDERGFDDTEIWCLTSSIVKFILPRLKAFRVQVHEHIEDTDNWYADIDSIIEAFQIVNDNDHWDFDEIQGEKVRVGLDKFRENFFNLWW